MKYKLLRFSLLSILAMLWGVVYADYYQKVTSTDDLTDGQYLIVYEDGALAFDGGQASLDAVSNTVDVEITDGQIASTEDVDAATFTIDIDNGTLKSASGYYIGVPGNSNGLKQTDEASTYTNSFSIDDGGNAVIKAVFNGSTMVLRYNASSGQTRFRYYKNAGQNAIQLYKKVEGGQTDNRVETILTLGECQTSGYVGGSMDVPDVTVTAGTTILDNPVINWESSNTEVATIEDGIINFSAVGATTITATYAGDETNYKGSSADFTLTVSEAPYTSIAAMLEDITSTKTKVTYQFENLLVTYVQGSNTYVSDGTNGFLFYGSELGLNPGEKISGTATGQIYTYSGLPEMALSANGINATVESEDNDVVWTTITPADLQNNINVPVTIENAVYVGAGTNKNLTFKVDDTEFAVYNNWSIGVSALEANKTYTLTGVGSVYVKDGTTTYQLYLVNFEATGGEITPELLDVTLSFPQESYEATIGEDFEEPVLTIDPAECDGMIAYASSDANVATVTVDGIVTLVGPGTVIITAQSLASSTYKYAETSYTLTVKEEETPVEPGELSCPYSYTFEAKAFEKEGTLTLANANWTLVTDAGYFGYDGTKGQQFGSGSKPASEITLTTSDIPGTITKVTVNTCGANGIDATFSVSVDETEFEYTDEEENTATSAELTKDATEYEFTGSASGDITLFWDNSSSKAIYVKSIYVEYTNGEEPAGFRDIKLNLMEHSELKTGSPVYITVSEDGSIGTTDDVTKAAATITASAHGSYGSSNFTASVPVEGCVKITYATHDFGNDITVTNSEDETVATLNTNGEKWMSNHDNVVVAYYRVNEPTTLNFSNANYNPYFAVEAIDEADLPEEVTEATLTFDATEAGADGTAPAAQKVEIGSTVTVPANTTLYKEGYTLTAWTDGSIQYTAGDVVTVDADMTLTPVFTENTVSFAERTSEVTVSWDATQKTGDAPLIGFEGNTGFIVGQAVVNGETIDMRLDIDATSGKFNNANGEWIQVNNGTKFTLPACKGAAYSIYTMDDSGENTFNGEKGTYASNYNTYTYEETEETMEIVVGGGTWYKAITAVYPVPEQEEVDDNVLYSWESPKGIVIENGGTAVASDNQSVGYANAGYTTIRLNGANDFTGATVTITLEKALKAGDEIAITGYRNKNAANKQTGALLKFNKGEATVSTATTGLEYVNIDTSDASAEDSNRGSEPNTVTLIVPEDAAGSKIITMTRAITSTNLFITKLVITGERSGDEPGDETYALTCEVNPENSGTVTVSLDEAGENVVEDLTAIVSGTELYVTATPEEGYKFLNFNVGNSNEAIQDNPYKFTLIDETSVVANFTEDSGEEPVIEYPILYTWDFTDANSDATKVGGGQGETFSYPSDKDADVTLEVDATNGKFSPRGNDVQVNATTTINVPVKAAGDVITIYNYRNGVNGVTYTIGTEEKTASDVTYEYTVSKIEAKTGFVTITVTGSGYMDKFTVLQNEPESEGIAVNATGSVSWALGNEASGTVADDIKAYVSSATASIGEGLGTSTKTVFDQQMLALKPATSNPGNDPDAMVEYRIKVAAGLTFTPTNVSYDAVKNGTDNASYSWSYVVDGTESTATTVSKDDIIRNNNTTGTPPMRHTENFSDVSGSEFAFRIYVSGFGNSKDLDIANIVINGTVSGTMIDVAKYKLTAVPSNDEAGSVSLYPAVDEYEEGTEVTLTATESFGYDFVNWTNSNGEEVSTEAKFKYTVNSDETLTANFEAVETYELALTVDGTNDYMVTIDPAPTMVDGKMMYEAGTAIKLMANSYNGLVTFNNWSDGETNSSKLISMSEDVTLTAVYEQADILAGWDFYKAGNSGRKADFASADNESAALSLMNTETGETSGWLDKSTLGAGGYESLNGAAVNWKTGSGNGDVGNWHWQTKVNASQFTNINVQFQMLYNYNAYQTYNAEYSLDGENWTKFGSIMMTGIKSPESFSEQLPEAANNQENLYIRMLADKENSIVDGTASANDGNALAMFFITGTEALVDDGTAPELVSTVPADGATGASASGKVVLTFDEKVKVADGTTATLGSLTLTPVVSGKSISFEYKGLEYSSEYNFSLPANSVSDLTDNALTEAISLTFTTMTRPTVTKGLYDAVVEDVDQLVAAINEANSRSDKNVRYRIFLKNGTYTLPLSTSETINSDDGNAYPAPFTKISASNISFIGESRDGVIVTNDLANAATYAGTYGETSVYDGIGKSDVLQLQSSASGTYFQDLTVKSGMIDARGRNIAVQDKGTQTIYKNTVLWGYQDTWTSNNDNGYYYFEGGKVRGRTDFLCGKGDAFFNAVGIQVCQAAGGYITAPSKSIKYGYVFKDCTIMGDYNLDGNYTLGRPWGQGTPMSLWIDTKMRIIPSAVGWSEMSGGWPKRFAEYNSMTSTGGTVDLSGRKTKFGAGWDNDPVLTAEEAFEAGDLHNMFGDWDPTLATEQAPVPQNVKQEGNSLVWDNSNYALLWAIVKDGAVVDFTTEPTYELTESGTYAVRAANEMGGLSEASESVEATVAEVVKVTLNASGYATLASSKPLDFSNVEGLTAYIVTAAKDSKATLTSVDAAPAETGLVLKGAENGEYEIPVVASATAVEGNLLVAAVNGATVDALSVYVLDDGKFKVFAGTEIPAGKAYLPKSKIGAARLLELVFDDATGIATVDVDVPVDVYDLQGRRVKTAKKGIYVVDGKKVIIK